MTIFPPNFPKSCYVYFSKNLKDIQKSRFRSRSQEFCQFLGEFGNFNLKKVSDSVSENLVLEKKCRVWFWKIWSQKKVLFPVSENFISEKKCCFQSKFCSRHSATAAHIGFMIILSLLLGNAEADGEY